MRTYRKPDFSPRSALRGDGHRKPYPAHDGEEICAGERFILGNELLIRSNLPAATQKVLEEMRQS
jgi:hypothetical protein